MRIRTIKPEFWTNELLCSLPESTHTLAAALLNYADDEGFFNANPGLIAGALYPLREPSVSIPESLKRLEKIGYIRLGTGPDGRTYGWIVNFTQHQTINRPSPSKISPLQIDFGDDGATQLSLTEDSHQEQGTGNREQGSTPTVPAEPGKKKKTKKPTAKEEIEAEPFQSQLRLLKAAYPKRAGSQPWYLASQNIHARLLEGHTWAEIIEGARRYARFCHATNKIGTEKVMQAKTFCGPDKRFLEEFNPPAIRTQSDRTATADSAAFAGDL